MFLGFICVDFIVDIVPFCSVSLLYTLRNVYNCL